MALQSTTRPHRRSSCVIRRVAAIILALHLVNLPGSSQTLATTIPLILPSAITFDSQGNLYLAETGNHTIRKVDSAGNITTVAGTGTQGFSGDNGPATSAQLDSPQGLALDASNHLYIADTHNHRIRRLELSTGIITTVAGSNAPGFDGDNGSATSAHLNRPTALVIDSSSNLYISDTQNHRIRKVSPSGIITTIAGNGIQGFSGDGGPATSAELDSPSGLAADAGHNLYIADFHNNRIRKVDATTGLITTIAGAGPLGYSGDNAQATSATIALPHGLTIDAAGNLYIADSANHRIRRIDAATGVISTIAGNGTQSFAGDGNPATQASLNAPQNAALTPSGLLVLADTQNQRIRQVSSDTTIHTIAGLGTTIPGVLTLSGPSVTAYGSGKLTATLATSATAQGSISFFDATSSGATTIAVVPAASNPATLDLSTLSAGQHSFTATYSGDQIHLAAQSNILSVSITPLPLTSTVTPATVLYGQTIPALTGTFAGVLPRDSSNLTASFTTAAIALSPVGSYPITAVLTGSAAGNYTVGPIPDLAITQAPTLTTLTALSGTVAPGQPITFTAHVASTTSGNPTGTVALFDGAASQLTAPVTATGEVTLTVSSLASGIHSLSAQYSGDSNFSSSASTAYAVTVSSATSSPADFTLTPTGATSASVVAGSSASFSFGVQIQNVASFSSPITLSASGLPTAATASFNPAVIPPGSSSNSFTLTITLPKSNLRQSNLNAVHPILVLLLLPILSLRSRKMRLLLLSTIASVAASSLTGCGDRIYTAAQSSSGAQPFTITVTGTATGPSGAVLEHTANVTLVVQQN